MTGNQIAYNRAQEERRHNVESERLGRDTLSEQIRHNVETESVNWFNAYEQQRHNKEGESINWFNANETRRHNYATENVAWFNASENKRHNIATEGYNTKYLKEVSRHNRETERTAAYNSFWNKEYQQGLLDNQMANLAWNKQYQSAQLAETHRSNKANEFIKSTANAINIQKVAEEVRHNKNLEKQSADKQTWKQFTDVVGGIYTALSDTADRRVRQNDNKIKQHKLDLDVFSTLSQIFD